MELKNGFTIIELILVLIIVGVLGTLSIQHMIASREIALDNEAKSNLNLIVSAEKSYRLESETGVYVSTTSTSDTNNKLNLAISGNFWEYKVVDVTATGFTAKAGRMSGNPPAVTRVWTIDQDDLEATSGPASAW